MSAVWNFFATSRGKSACNGLGGTAKRLAARANLHRLLNNQILSASEGIPNIKFAIIRRDEMVLIRKILKQRFAEGQTVPGACSYHHIEPLADAFGVQWKRTSKDVQFKTVFSFKNHAKCIQTSPGIKRMSFIACCYDLNW